MEAITIPHVRIPSINIGGICLPGIGAPGSIGKKGLIWPAGMKEHIKAWYDPKKQGLTNFDVIEAYTEDFSKYPWNNKTEKYVGNLTSKALTVTEVLVRSALMYTNIKPYNFKVRITGLINNQKVIFGDDTSTYRALIVDKDGVYDVNWEDNHRDYCIWIDFIGECNITITQLPTSILQDFSGNGNHAYLYGGKGKLNSGMGVYQEDFSINTWNKTSFVFDYSHDYIKAKFKTINAGYRNVTVSNSNVSLNSMKIKVIIKGNSKDNRIMYSYADENGAQKVYYINNGETGIVPKSIATKTNDFLVGFRYNENNGDDCEITITQIPDYPDQLCYDGKMYAVAYDMPILTDYTVMAERTWFEKEEYSAFISNSLGGIEEPNNGAFCVEIKSLNSFTTSSFGSLTSIGIPEKGITYQTKQSYNGNSINVGTKESNDILILGGRYFYKNDNAAGNTWNGCHGAIIVADRSFTEEEINWLKQNWDKI